MIVNVTASLKLNLKFLNDLIMIMVMIVSGHVWGTSGHVRVFGYSPLQICLQLIDKKQVQ